MVRNFTITTHYYEDDKEMHRDYAEITIEDEEGKIIAHYGDDYHEKGWDRSEGFVDGVKYLLGDKGFELTAKRIADYTY